MRIIYLNDFYENPQNQEIIDFAAELFKLNYLPLSQYNFSNLILKPGVESFNLNIKLKSNIEIEIYQPVDNDNKNPVFFKATKTLSYYGVSNKITICLSCGVLSFYYSEYQSWSENEWNPLEQFTFSTKDTKSFLEKIEALHSFM